jgi:hypothetical protein
MSRLRSKIEADPSHPRYLLTKVGVGYMFAAPEKTNFIADLLQEFPPDQA